MTSGEMVKKEAVLYVVATPIGNILDLSDRAKNILSSADLVACEDTRATGKLFERMARRAPKLVSYHDRSSAGTGEKLVKKILEEQLTCALVSDAGTPCIADPGFKLVRAAHSSGLRVVPVPGPSALTSFLMSSGLSTDRFLFSGFLPHKVEAKANEIENWTPALGTVVFYETATRIQKTFSLVKGAFPASKIAIGRELTKTYEQIFIGAPVEALDWLKALEQSSKLKGEFVCGVSDLSPRLSLDEKMEAIESSIDELLARGLTQKQIMKEMSGCGLVRGDLYSKIIERKRFQ